MFTSLEFRLSAAVAWQELDLQFCGAVALAKRLNLVACFSYPALATELAVWDKSASSVG